MGFPGKVIWRYGRSIFQIEKGGISGVTTQKSGATVAVGDFFFYFSPQTILELSGCSIAGAEVAQLRGFTGFCRRLCNVILRTAVESDDLTGSVV